MMKKYVAVLLAIGLLTLPAQAAVTGAPDVDAQAAVLLEKANSAGQGESPADGEKSREAAS